MATPVERVRAICKERKIPISKLEKDLGFGNGFLNPKKASDLTADRAIRIAEYLDVSVNFLLGLTPEQQLQDAEAEFNKVSAELDADPDNFELQCRYDALKEQVEDAKLAANMMGIKKEPGVVNNSELKEEVFKIAKEISQIPELEALFHAARGNSTNNILAVAEMLQKFKDASGR